MTLFDVSRFARCRVLIIGDLMMDEYVWGAAERISPEAPVPVVTVDKEDYTLGGAGNVVNNLAHLGATVSVGGVIGTFEDGDRMMTLFQNLGVDASGVIRDPRRPTTRKTRIVAAHQHVLRIDRETRKEISEDAFEKLRQFIEDKMPSSDVVLVSDYGKGVITRPLIRIIAQAARRHNKKVIADPKGLDFSKYEGVTLLTPNRKEAALASGVEINDSEALMEAGRRIMESSKINHLLITRGKDGMMLLGKEDAPYAIGTEARQVYDVSGAGDTVLSVFGLGVAAGLPMQRAADLANTAAGIVVAKVGTAPVTQAELTAVLNRGERQADAKLRSVPEMAAIVQEFKRKGRKVVLTNGCFDLLHTGHVMLFAESKQMGDVLIVAIDDDASVRRVKGPGRPVLGETERVRILGALDSVDYVVVFSSDHFEDLLESIRPDVLTKGSNYASEEVRGGEKVESFGGRVALIPVLEGKSATGMIESIKAH